MVPSVTCAVPVWGVSTGLWRAYGQVARGAWASKTRLSEAKGPGKGVMVQLLWKKPWRSCFDCLMKSKDQVDWRDTFWNRLLLPYLWEAFCQIRVSFCQAAKAKAKAKAKAVKAKAEPPPVVKVVDEGYPCSEKKGGWQRCHQEQTLISGDEWWNLRLIDGKNLEALRHISLHLGKIWFFAALFSARWLATSLWWKPFSASYWTSHYPAVPAANFSVWDLILPEIWISRANGLQVSVSLTAINKLAIGCLHYRPSFLLGGAGLFSVLGHVQTCLLSELLYSLSFQILTGNDSAASTPKCCFHPFAQRFASCFALGKYLLLAKGMFITIAPQRGGNKLTPMEPENWWLVQMIFLKPFGWFLGSQPFFFSWV